MSIHDIAFVRLTAVVQRRKRTSEARVSFMIRAIARWLSLQPIPPSDGETQT